MPDLESSMLSRWCIDILRVIQILNRVFPEVGIHHRERKLENVLMVP